MAFDFGSFMRETNSRIDSLQKKKDERNKLRDMQAQDIANRQMSEIESTGRQNRFALNQKAQMEKKAFETADDNEYYRKKAAWDVKAGNMNPDTYDMLYSGAAASGGFPAAKGGLRGKGQSQEPDYLDVLSKAYAAKPENDDRSFSQFAAEEMEGLKTTFPQQGQGAQNETLYKKNQIDRQMDFGKNITMSRDSAGKMRFGMGQQGAENAGWERVQGNVQKNRLNNPRIAPSSNAQGFELPTATTLGQAADNIYNGARRNMMSPVAPGMMNPSMSGMTTPSSSVVAPATNPVRNKIGLSNKGAITTIPTASDDESEQRRNKRLRGGYVDSPFGR